VAFSQEVNAKEIPIDQKNKHPELHLALSLSTLPTRQSRAKSGFYALGLNTHSILDKTGLIHQISQLTAKLTQASMPARCQWKQSHS